MKRRVLTNTTWQGTLCFHTASRIQRACWLSTRLGNQTRVSSTHEITSLQGYTLKVDGAFTSAMAEVTQEFCAYLSRPPTPHGNTGADQVL